MEAPPSMTGPRTFLSLEVSWMTLLRSLAFLLGVAAVLLALRSAIQTFVLPRSARDRLTGMVFQAVRRLFDLRIRWIHSYRDQDRIMAFYAPLSLLMLLPTWLGIILAGYMAMFWGLGAQSWGQAFWLSGSSLFTLGFATADTRSQQLLIFSEATIGLILVALLIAYLPTMYGAFSRREAAVTLLEIRAGSPPSAAEMLIRFHRLGTLDHLSHQWVQWEQWFADLGESHTSLAPLVFFRSPQPEHSWLTAAGTVLDAAALVASTVDVPRDAQAELCIRAGFVALRQIADFFRIPYNPDPHFPQDPISICRQEFDEVYQRFAAEGIPVKPDQEQAWRDFAGWRVNYDTVLLSLALMIHAPYAPWTSDRSPVLPLGQGQPARPIHWAR